MDPNKQKEHFGISFIRVLATVAGIYVQEPKDDIESEDLVLAAKRIGSPRLAVQAKCSSSIAMDSDDFAFELRISDYNHLRDTRAYLPRILVVVEVPPGEPSTAWIGHGPEECCMRRAAYWTCLTGRRALPNQASVTIRIPKSSRLTVDALLVMMEKVAAGEKRLES